MSKVAQAKQEVSENPSSRAVNVPQDAKFKEKDVNQKLKFYGVIQAFKNVSLFFSLPLCFADEC
jgi:hypothetical protein